MPIYANARVYFCDRKWSPFFDLRLGYYIPIVKGERVEKYWNSWNSDEYGFKNDSHIVYGFSIGGTIGIQCKNFEFGLSARTVKVLRVEEYVYYDESSQNLRDENDRLSGMIRAFFAYNFQLKKK